LTVRTPFWMKVQFFFFWKGCLNVKLESIVFKSGPIQGLGSGFWSGHRVVRVNFLKKKISKPRRFSKKQKSTDYNRVLLGQSGHIRFFLQFDLISAPSHLGLGLTCQTGPDFKTMVAIASSSKNQKVSYYKKRYEGHTRKRFIFSALG